MFYGNTKIIFGKKQNRKEVSKNEKQKTKWIGFCAYLDTGV
jgi:hypothetical protein